MLLLDPQPQKNTLKYPKPNLHTHTHTPGVSRLYFIPQGEDWRLLLAGSVSLKQIN